jgi:hypothetical protein
MFVFFNCVEFIMSKERRYAFRVPNNDLVALARSITGVSTERRPNPVKDEHYYVYVLCDSRKPGTYEYTLLDGKKAVFQNKPFYVGKGTGMRSESHLREALARTRVKGFNIYKERIINKILDEDLEVDIKVCKPRFNEETAYAYEVLLIHAIGRHDLKTGPLTNLSVGGEGAVGLSPKSRRKAARSYKRWWANLSDEELQAFKDGKRADTKAFFESLSAEEYTAYVERSNAKRIATFANRTEEERCINRIKRSAGLKAHYATTTSDERGAIAAKTQATIAKKSDAEKALTTERHRTSAKAWYANLTDEQRAEMKRKQDEAKANMPTRVCPWCATMGRGGNMTRNHFTKCKDRPTNELAPIFLDTLVGIPGRRDRRK